MSRTRVLDPKAVPVAGVDHHLSAIPPAALTAQALQHRFARALPWHPEIPGDGRPFVESDGTDAAVLIPLVQRDDGLHVLLTRRTAHLRSHAGQISFPGGRCEASDRDATETALRETEEEVGLSRARVAVLGTMPVYTTVTRFVVTPVIGLVQPPLELVPDPFEVAEAFEVPLAFLMNPAHHRRHVFHYEGGQHQFLSMPWSCPGPDGGEREYFIWGATAAMLRNLYRFLAV